MKPKTLYAMKYNVYALMILLCAITGCGSKGAGADHHDEQPVDSARTVNIDLSAPLDHTAGLESESILQLDEDCDNIMGMPHNIIVRGDTIFAIDALQSPGIYMYYKDGRQLLAYCKPGTGPGDITSPSGLTVTDTEISTFDTASGKIVVIDKRGNYKRSIDVPLTAQNAILDKNDAVWVDYTNQLYDDTRLSWRKDTVSEYTTVLTVPDFAKGITVIELQPLQTAPDGTMSYLPVMEPRIYSLCDGKAHIRYNLDFGPVWPDEETLKKNFTGNDWLRKSRDFPIQSMRFHESDKYLAVGFRYDDRLFVTIYDKESGDAHTYQFDKDIYGGSKYVTDSQLYMYRTDDGIEIFRIK